MPKDRKKKEGKRHINKRLHIVCEGLTEYNYLKRYVEESPFYNLYEIVIVHETVKNTGKELVKELKRIKTSIQSTYPSDEMWAVFDKDGYTKHAEAFNQAKALKFNIAFSSISIEYWILLHFEYTTKPFPKDKDIIKYFKNKGYFIEYDKSDDGIYKKIKDKIPTAIRNAVKVRKYQEGANPNMEKYKINPYTDIDLLLEAIDNVGKLYT